jgi:NDP-sugar pyrophosphorylase family protein
MAGFGDRYRRAGYTEPKPLIPVDGATMIERVLDTFPKDARYLFGINKTHAETTDVRAVLEKLRPGSPIVVLEPHKDGPIQTVLACAEHIPDDEDVLLNYCDFGVDWSFPEFAKWLVDGNFDGAMTAYKGFHPHSLGPTLYAYMKNDGDRVTEIREKHHFTPDKFSEYASSGLYWFRRGKDLVRISRQLVEEGNRVNGEFYVSMAMQKLVEEKQKVGVFPLKHFYQWGTPEDLRDYESWARAMRSLDGFLPKMAKATSRGAQVIPMAGRGQRFVDQGYEKPKPLIDVGGRPMIAQAMACLPRPTQRVLVALSDHAKDEKFRAEVKALEAPTRIVELTKVTEGQACSALLGVDGLDLDAPVLFAPCDTGYVYDVDKWLALEKANDCDLILFTAKNHLPALWRPQMYGWLSTTADGLIDKVAVKKQVEGVPPAEQEVVTGTFWFKSARLYEDETNAMIAANDRVNNEFYIDTIARRMVERGARVRAFTVDKYMPWGTPEELKTFLYWNEVFRGGKSIERPKT